MTDQCELHKQNTQVYATEWPPGTLGRATEESGANAEDKGHSPEQGDSFPMAFLDKEEINHIHLL